MIERAKVVPQPFFAFSLRSSFKQAAYSEFRQDWSGALKHYQAAYRCAQEMAQSVGRGGGGVQRQAELRAVSEQMHVKILSLMLYQQRPGEALEQIDRHIAAFRPPKGGGLLHPAAAAAAHWGWLSQQYTVAGQLLSERGTRRCCPTRPARARRTSSCARRTRRPEGSRRRATRPSSSPAPSSGRCSPGRRTGASARPPTRSTCGTSRRSRRPSTTRSR
uniref:Trafficking protein particle complex subunit 11-like n=1 Tax=Tetraselmis sp. GSL018 TaxID=582737 RepID=A0A061SC41_9CHLO